MISWIESEVLDEHVGGLLESVDRSLNQAAKTRAKNVVDPFSSLLIAKALGFNEVRDLEKTQDLESALRSFSNALGEFHQSVLGSVEGWCNHDAGYDLECEGKQMIAEIKNKHNTMNASNREKVEDELHTALRQKRGVWKGYIVQIVPKKPERYETKINSRKSEIYNIDGASFYELVTGDPRAIHNVFDYLGNSLGLSQEIIKHCANVMKKAIPE